MNNLGLLYSVGGISILSLARDLSGGLKREFRETIVSLKVSYRREFHDKGIRKNAISFKRRKKRSLDEEQKKTRGENLVLNLYIPCLEVS